MLGKSLRLRPPSNTSIMGPRREDRCDERSLLLWHCILIKLVLERLCEKCRHESVWLDLIKCRLLRTHSTLFKKYPSHAEASIAKLLPSNLSKRRIDRTLAKDSLDWENKPTKESISYCSILPQNELQVSFSYMVAPRVFWEKTAMKLKDKIIPRELFKWYLHCCLSLFQ